MGQQQLTQLQLKLNQPNALCPENTSSLAFAQEILKQSEEITGQPLTAQEIQQHIVAYLGIKSQQSDIPCKRRRSYELLHSEDKIIEELREKQDELNGECKVLQQKMRWLEDIEEQVRTNITQIMTTQKTFKIRQYFRKIILQILKLDNLLFYVLTPLGKLQFHDFSKNYITDIQDQLKLQTIQRIIKVGYNPQDTLEVFKNFELANETAEERSLYQWNVIKQNKLNLCFVIKKLEYQTPCRYSHKVIAKIANIAMISTSEEEASIIQNYSKDFLQVLELLVNQCEAETCEAIGFAHTSMMDVEKDLLNREDKDEMLLGRVEAFQQLQFELLERIRMYKKYVCEDDKIFMQFDESAQLSFLSNNFSHPLFKRLPQLWQRKKMFIEKIFQDYKPITEFIKKAVQRKVKPNKLYEINFESKVRVKYDHEGRITKMHVIFEELDNSSSSSSNLYNSSSTKILSEESMKGSFNELEEGKEREYRQSALVRNLEKDNPGIINQGWINLFIKDQHLNPRNNSHFKNRAGKGYTVKRSISLNHSLQTVPESNEVKDNLQPINVESIDLNLLELEQQLLQPLVIKVFKRLQFFHGQNINQAYFLNFLADIHNGYQIHNNPFHNFTHGVNVMHTCYLLAYSNKNRQLLSPFKIFTIVFSGLCHDVGHTGFTNLFEIASGSKKAITYNDNSPLQNFHAAYTFQLLRKPQNNFLKELSAEKIKDFRKSVISNILYTDIKEHFPLLKKFNTLIKNQLPINDQYFNILSGMIVHTADFGGSAKEFQICKAWSLKVNLEFSNQYKREGQLGLPQTPFMKDLSNISVLSKNEGGFLKVIVFPLYEAMDQYCGNDQRVRRLREYAEQNIKKWQQIHSQSQPSAKGIASS